MFAYLRELFFSITQKTRRKDGKSTGTWISLKVSILLVNEIIPPVNINI